jgi:hypothetical protein
MGGEREAGKTLKINGPVESFDDTPNGLNGTPNALHNLGNGFVKVSHPSPPTAMHLFEIESHTLTNSAFSFRASLDSNPSQRREGQWQRK